MNVDVWSDAGRFRDELNDLSGRLKRGMFAEKTNNCEVL